MRSGVTLALLSTLAFKACGEPPEAAAPVPAEGLTAVIEGLLFGTSETCRDDADCRSGACLYGMCAGLLSVDERARLESIALRLDKEVPVELRRRVTDVLVATMQREELGQNSRARAALALGHLHWDGHRPALEAALSKAPAALAEVIALELMTPPPPKTALELVVELARSTEVARAVEALRALGGSASPEALLPLLESLSPDLDLEVQRAAIAGLSLLGDKRAIRPLVRHLTLGPEPLADEIALGLRGLTGEAFGPLPLAWDDWVSRNTLPEPPPYEPRTHRSEDDLDLPTP